ncbi:MAG: AbrB/MazE/SpoVT family DNA-binding domain-containing protein [Spirochaetes bacterium]|nr:AbrB/MazE/SpoVT family DNA-binding domain-containing protein [Spirochaetota bacterium]
MLTLPKEWVKALKWRAKQMAALELKDGYIVIKDVKSK